MVSQRAAVTAGGHAGAAELCTSSETTPLPRRSVPSLGAGGSDGTDLEIQPLRVTVSREAWEGLPGAFTPSSPVDGAAEQQEASRRWARQPGAGAAALGAAGQLGRVPWSSVRALLRSWKGELPGPLDLH